MAQLMPLPLTVSCFSKIRCVSVCVCVCVLKMMLYTSCLINIVCYGPDCDKIDMYCSSVAALCQSDHCFCYVLYFPTYLVTYYILRLCCIYSLDSNDTCSTSVTVDIASALPIVNVNSP